MSDTTVTTNITSAIPLEILMIITSFLEPDDLARFKQVCKNFNWIGAQAMILQPLHNRLYALDDTLPVLLPKDNAWLVFKHSFEKIWARQQKEIAYLKKWHINKGVDVESDTDTDTDTESDAETEFDSDSTYTPVQMIKAISSLPSMTLKSLEDCDVLLDAINIELIKRKININQTTLSLSYTSYLTRLPVSLLKDPIYANYWKNLTQLDCDYNHFITLNLQELTGLQNLICNNNQLITLKVQGLTALQKIICHHNKLTTLEVQNLTALQQVYCFHNQLNTLNLQGLTALEELGCYNNQLTTLDLQELTTLRVLQCGHNQINSLNLSGLTALGWTTSFENNLLINLNLSNASEYIQNSYDELEISLLFKQLFQAAPDHKSRIITKLGALYTKANHLYYFYDCLTEMGFALPALLPYNLEEAELLFQQEAAKIKACQEKEINYLKAHHPTLVAQYANQFQENSSANFKHLDTINTILNKINLDIIVPKISLGSLQVNNSYITRLPINILKAMQLPSPVQNLTSLFCQNNQLTKLDLQGLKRLKTLYLNENPLIDLNLTGVSKNIKKEHIEFETKLLFQQLNQANPSVKPRFIARLGERYNHLNCSIYLGPECAEMLFPSEDNNITSSATYLPSASTNSNSANAQQKRPSEEENQSNEPDTKKRKHT